MARRGPTRDGADHDWPDDVRGLRDRPDRDDQPQPFATLQPDHDNDHDDGDHDSADTPYQPSAADPRGRCGRMVRVAHGLKPVPFKSAGRAYTSRLTIQN